ncbi:LexA family transcriptional regulator [Hymenobacter sp. BT188]|nr:LexA family transcriptional regulator [Hymenobacter sp. BT188]
MSKLTRAGRLIDLRLNTGMSQRAVAEKLNKLGFKISAASISSYEADDSIKIKRPLLQKLAELYKSNTTYIETGTQPQPNVAFATGNKPYIGEPKDVRFRHPSTLEEFLNLPAVPVRARTLFMEMAGSGSDYSDLEIMRAYNPSSELHKVGSIAIEVDGDSMEPQLRSGMWVAAYPIDPSDFKYVSSGVYVVDFGSSLVIKRIKDNDLLTDGTLTLHSDNERAGKVTIKSNDLRRLWRVVDVIRARVI